MNKFWNRLSGKTVKKNKTAKKEVKPKKPVWREWTDALIFAVIAASIIRWLLMEPFTIPTGSMEKSLLIGDFLFVSKVNYGPRLPRTPLSVPLVHNKLPFSERNSYLEWINIPYKRIPGFQRIKNNDVVVFNYPADETRPVDKKENYIKRCVGIGGDTLEIRQGVIYINNEIFQDPVGVQFMHYVKTSGGYIPRNIMRDLGVREDDWGNVNGDYGGFLMFITDETANELRKQDYVERVEKQIRQEGIFDSRIFPHSTAKPWNVDNFGPLYIPARGDTIYLNAANFPAYERAIREYENNPDLILQNDLVYLNGEEIEYYVFQMDYYFMIGDNRHNSEDSRMWGFVPKDHVVGKAVLLWLSLDYNKKFLNKVRWERLFKRIK